MRRNWNTYLAARKNQLRALKNIPHLFALLWDAGSGLVVAELCSRLLIGLLPLAGLWVGKLIIDSVVNALRHPGSDSHWLWILLAAEFGIGALAAVLGRAIEYWDGRNLPFNEWTEAFGSERLTGALLDRLTHHVHILEMNGDSYRLKDSKRKRPPKLRS